MVIYLSGGFKTGWQQEVTDVIMGHRDDAVVLDPSAHLIHDPKLYVEADLGMIRDCDMVFAFMEATNPSMSNLSFELGYACALGKTIVLVNQKGQRWAEMMHFNAHVHTDLQGALAALPLMKEFRK